MKRYGAIYSDPPWRFECWSGKGTERSAYNHYDTMTIDDIKADAPSRICSATTSRPTWGWDVFGNQTDKFTYKEAV